jgi:hypothetical protein
MSDDFDLAGQFLGSTFRVANHLGAIRRQRNPPLDFKSNSGLLIVTAVS